MKDEIIKFLLYLTCSTVISVFLIYSAAPYESMAESPQTQTATQTVTINEPAETYGPDKVNINIATVHELETLPGIGASLAKDIIGNRPYADPYELMDIDGIGYKTMQNIIDRIEV